MSEGDKVISPAFNISGHDWKRWKGFNITGRDGESETSNRGTTVVLIYLNELYQFERFERTTIFEYSHRLNAIDECCIISTHFKMV